MKKKRFLAGMLAAVLLFAAVPLPVFARAANNDKLDMKKIAEFTPEPTVFSKLELSSSWDEKANKLNMRFDFALDNDNYHALFEKDTELTPDEIGQIKVGVSFDYILRDNVKMPEESIAGTCTTSANETVADYTITPDQDGATLHFECNIRTEETYTKNDITAGQSFELEVEGDNIESVTPSLAEKDGKVEVSVAIKEKPTAGGVEGLDYELTKELKSRDLADPKFEYTITAAAKAKEGSQETPRLNGLTIRDTLPEGLVLDSVKLGDSTDALETEQYKYDAQTREFSYTVTPEYKAEDPSTAISKVALTLVTRVEDTLYQEYIKNTSDTYKKEFKNTAELRDGNEKLPLAESEEVSGALSGAFFSKDGKVAGSNGKLYQWTITANTHFGSATMAYIVDMIPNTDVHMYEKAPGNVSFSLNSNVKSATKITPTELIKYENLNLENIKALTSTGGTGGSDGAVYYTVGEQAIMIIPVAPTEKVTITYRTGLKPSDKKTPMLENRAKILWEIPEGAGPGKYEPPTGDIEKTVTANVSDIQKTGGKYDPKTQKLTWDFEINHAGVEMQDVVITDTLYDSKQTLVSIKKDGETGGMVKWDGTSPAPYAPYYIEIVDTDNHTHTYEIHLGDIPASTLYQLSLTTKVVDPAVLSQQDAAVSGLTNKATMAYGPTDTRKEESVEGTKTVPNTLITKTAVGTYDFIAHTLKWKITINPNSLTIKNAVLTDLLPEGNTFRSLDAVARGTTDATGNLIEGGKEATVNNSNGSSFQFENENLISVSLTTKEDNTFSKDEAKLELGEINQAYVFELTTTVDEDYRDAILRDLQSHPVTNTAMLTGTIANKVAEQPNGKIKATATADHTITAPPVAKSGVYHKKDTSQYPDLGNIDYITWTLVVNPDGVDMAGATIKDELYDWFELDTASLKIYKAVIDQDGEATQGEVISNPAGLTATEKGFEYEIPKNLSRQPLILTFNTLVTDTAGAGDMKNTVSLVWGSDDAITTSDAGAAGAKEFDLGSYATATSVPLLRIKKVSASSDALPLSGAVFTLTKMKQENGAWVADGTPKSKTTSAREGVEGTASFLFLAADTLYKLEETAAPAGYETAAPQYFVFGGELPKEQYPEKTTMLDANGTAYAKVHTIRDTPTGSLAFTKHVANSGGTAGAPLPNIGFTLTLDGTAIEHKSISDADGKVRFTALDPGSYTLTEDDKPTLSWTVTVTAGEATRITANNGAPLIGTAESGYTIINTITQAEYGTVKGKKTTSSGAPLAGAVIGLFKDGETLAAYKATSGDDGTFTFSLVKPDSYTLREISAPAGYDLNDKTIFSVAVTANKETDKDQSNADIVIQNERTQTNTGGGGGGSSNGRLTIEKTSDDGTKQGFTFRIKGSGYDKTFVTNAAGKIEIAALATGTYTVTEVETGAAAHYEIPDGQTVKLTSKGATLAFHNKLKAELPPVDPNDPNKPVNPNDPNKPNDPTDPNKPTDPDQPADPGKPDGSGKPGGNTGVEGAAGGKTPSGGTSGGKTLLSPKTDYRSPLSLWLALAFLSAAGFALCAGRLRGKRYRGRHQRR